MVIKRITIAIILSAVLLLMTSVGVLATSFISVEQTITQEIEPAPSGGGGGGGAGPPPHGCTIINPGIITLDGVLTASFVAVSTDDDTKIELAKGTICLTKWGIPISYICLLPIGEAYYPQLPDDTTAVGIIYDFDPGGVTFDPSGTLIFSYDGSLVPEDANEEDLVIVYWDVEVGEWVVLEGCVVDPEVNTVTAMVSHFTFFAVLSYEVEAQPVEPEPVAPVEPTPVEPTPVEPTPTPVEPTPVEPTPVEPTPVEPTPVEPEPVEPVEYEPIEPEESGGWNIGYTILIVVVLGVGFVIWRIQRSEGEEEEE